MFCHACGAKNAEGSRFCNMCGASFAVPMPLDKTQVGVGEAAGIAKALAEVRASSPEAFAKPPSTHPGLGPTPTSTRPPPERSSVRPQGAERASTRPPGSGRTSMRPGLPEDFDPSLSIHLDAIGIRSPRKLYLVAFAVAALMLGLGAVATYFFVDEPGGHASPGDPFEIGLPTADVDFVTGEANPPAAPAPSSSDAGVAPRREPPSNVTTTGVTSMGSSRTEPLRTVDPPAPPPLPETTPSPAPPEVTPPPSSPEPATPPPTTAPPEELDAEMYAARVRYLVRRYYAGRAQTCFHAATERNPAVSGQVVLAMHIGADGNVTNARVSRNTTGDDALGECLARQAEEWHLAPPPNGEADITFPFSR